MEIYTGSDGQKKKNKSPYTKIEQWNRLPRVTVHSPFLKSCKTQEDKTLRNLD